MPLKDSVKLPTRRIQLPKSKEILDVRSFTMREKNSLQLSLESSDNHTISSTLKNVIEACISQDIIVTDLPLIDVEFIFLQMLKMSTGRYIEVGYKCNMPFMNGSVEEVCGYHNDVKFDLDETTFSFVESPDKKMFKITEEVHVEFSKLSSNDIFESFATIATATENSYNPFVEQKEKYMSSLTRIIDGDKVIDPKDRDQEEVWELIEYIPADVMDEVDEFISDIDKIVLTKDFKCHKCGYNYTVEHKGLEDFLE